MPYVLVTGGSGFFGGVLKRRLLREGATVVNIDLERDEDSAPGLTSIRGDLRDPALVKRTFAEHRFDAVYHVAAQLAHGMKLDHHLLWSSNVDATRLLAETARENGVRPFVFVSSNCLWAGNLGHPVREDRDVPNPIEPYGKSKLAGEKVLQEFTSDLDVVILRCPTIIDAGRLGLLAILFDFIAAACIQAAAYGRSDLFHIGSDHVKSMREVYEAVIRASGGRSRVRSLPKKPAIAAMKLAHMLRISPLGPYHYNMIAESFQFDTSRIKERLGWRPTLTNEEMLLKAYEYYAQHRAEITARTDVSAHRKPASMGVIGLLKWIS